MGIGFGGRHEAGADPDAAGAGGQSRCQSSTGADAARRQHGQVNCGQHLVEQRLQPNRAADVSARRNALRHDEVAAGLGRGNRLLAGAHLPRDQRAALMHQLDPGTIGPAVKELDHPRRSRRQLEAAWLDVREILFPDEKVDPERTRCERRHSVQQRAETLDGQAPRT